MTPTIRRALVPLLACAVANVACGTSYSPRTPGQLSFVLTARGEEALDKDGKTYPIGGFSGDLLAAVHGHEAAEAHARTYVRRTQVGAALLGVMCVAFVVAGFFFIGAVAEPAGGEPSAEPTGSRTGAWTGVGVAGLAGAAALVGAAIELSAASGHLYDAVNLYNDDVASRPAR